jgi:cysteine synthase A
MSAANSPDGPVVVFGLEWCEFSWSVQRFQREAGVPFLAVNLDDTADRNGRLGDRLRWVLRDRVGSATLPQVLVASVKLV